jgi:large subunit ribosomal protein L21
VYKLDLLESEGADVMYAIIETGGKQYRVEKGMRLDVERLDAEPGETFVFERVLMLGGGEEPRVGTPVVDGARVSARVIDHHRADKVMVYKMKRRKTYRVKRGHRQLHTRVEITEIEE